MEQKKAEEIIEITELIIIDVFIGIYSIGRFNLPSLFGMNTVADTQN